MLLNKVNVDLQNNNNPEQMSKRDKQFTVSNWSFNESFNHFRPGSSHSWYTEHYQSTSRPDVHKFNGWIPAGSFYLNTPDAYDANRWSLDYRPPRGMYNPVQPSWLQRSAPRSFQPNPYKWVHPSLRKEPHHTNAQGEHNLPLHDMSDRSCNWSERSRSVCSTSSQASSSISSIVPKPAYKFEPASLYEEEPEFLELWGTL